MIDICMVVHRNYDLLGPQLEYFKHVKSDFRLLIADNTPLAERVKLNSFNDQVRIFPIDHDPRHIDGESHGGALDFLVRQAESDIVGVMDSDFFWHSPNLLDEIALWFRVGFRCVGAELFYDDFAKVNARYPERAGWKAPCVFGMFVERQLALSETFVVTAEEGREWFETGWRLRKKVIDEQIPCRVFPAFQFRDQSDKAIWHFGDKHRIYGTHVLKGSGLRMGTDITKIVPKD